MRATKRVTAVMVIAMTIAAPLPVRGAEPTAAPVGVDPGLVAHRASRSGPVAVEGQLLDRKGNPTSGTVEALVWPTESALSQLDVGGAAQTIPMAAAQAGSDGRYELRLDPSTLPAGYVGEDGQVDLELIAWNASWQRRWFTSVRSDSAGGAPVWLATTAGENLTSTDATQMRVQASISLTEERKAVTSPSPQAPNPCPPQTLVSTHNVWVMIGRSMNYNATQTSWMHDGASHSVTLGVAVSAQSTVGYSAGGTSTTTTGVTFDWAPSSSDRRYYVQVQYGKYRFACAGQQQYTFRPRFPTGGFTSSVVSYDPAWTHCAAVSAGTWTRATTQGNATVFGGGVEAAGVININLSMESSYASTRSLSYKQTVSRRLCGNDAMPSQAGEIEGEG